MRRTILFTVGVLLASGVLLAQSHDNMRERMAKDTIVLTSDVRVGQYQLAAGEYRVICDRETIVFTQTTAPKARFEFKCQGKELSDVRKTTEVHTATTDGKKWLYKLYLRGSNVEHVFQ